MDERPLLTVLSEVTLVAPDQLRAAPWNPQQHPPAQIEQIKRSLVEFGFVAPVLVRRSDDQIVGGHGRLLAVEELLDEGFALPGGGIPVLYGEWDDDTLVALNVALNHIQSTADTARLGAAIAELRKRWTVERLTVTGLGRDQIEELANRYGDRLNQTVSRSRGGLAEKDPKLTVLHLKIPPAVYQRYTQQRQELGGERGMTDAEWLTLALDAITLSADVS